MSCHPECSWVCDDPTGNAVCVPQCEEPRCHVQWREAESVSSPPPDPLLTPPGECQTPTFSSSVECGDGQCELDDCPACAISVSAVAQDCPGYTVEVVCEPTSCEWRCEQPDLPTPDCQLQCEQPSCLAPNSFSVIHTNAPQPAAADEAQPEAGETTGQATAEATASVTPSSAATDDNNGFEVATYVLSALLAVALVVAVVFVVLYVQKLDLFV